VIHALLAVPGSVAMFLAGSGLSVAVLHRYFLDFANSLPDLKSDAGYWKRTAFNFIQGAAGNKDRVITKLPN
jgi:hypothetical protein